MAGGIFGNPNNHTIEVCNGKTTGDNSNEPSAAQVINTDTLAYPITATTDVSDSKPDNPPANDADDSDDATAGSYCSCTKTSTTPSKMTPTTVPPFVSLTNPSAITNATPQQVTVTITLIPQLTTFPPQTRTISPEDASLIIASLKATSGSTAGPEALDYNSPVAVPTSAQAPVVVASSGLPLAAQGGIPT